MDNNLNLTTAQSNVRENLPGTANELADAVGCSTSTIRDHIAALRERGVTVESIKDTYVESAQPTNPTSQSITASKQAQSKAANEHLARLNDRLNEVLENSSPAVADGGLSYNPSNEDVVIHRSDEHIGTEAYDEHGNMLTNSEETVERMRKVTRFALDSVIAQEEVGKEFDTAHLLLGGDTVTGENIYSHQPHKIDLTLDKQIDKAVEVLFDQIKQLSRHFPSVQVVTQAGNHGELRAEGMSEMANADRIVYMFLDKLVRMSDLENVTFIRNQSTNYTNFRLRVNREEDLETAEALGVPVDELDPEHQSGYRAHLRHGQDSLSHIGTSSGKNRWRGWKIQHKLDMGYRGHYHEFKLEHVMNAPVLMSGSVIPPDDYEESLSEWSEPAATVHGVSDDHCMPWINPIKFN